MIITGGRGGRRGRIGETGVRVLSGFGIKPVVAISQRLVNDKSLISRD